MATTTILSPHADDAVLSLWGLLERPGEVAVLNVFDGVPDGQRSLGWWDRLTHAEDALTRAAERRAEDRAALGLVGRRASSLGFADEQYRDVEPRLEALVERIAQALEHDSVVLAPAALGEHADHRWTRTAALALRERGFQVALYADVPHATRHGWPAWVTGAPGGSEADPMAQWEDSTRGAGLSLRELAPRIQALAPDQRERKRRAVDCYCTQMPALEATFSLLSRPEILGYEVIWPLTPS